MLKLDRLTLRNFKGVRDFTLDPKGEDITVYGDNETGKTTLADALMWILFDKNSENKKDFEIKTLRPDGTAIPELEHEVEAILTLADGRLLSLRKVYTEVRTKKRGNAHREFTGHTTDHYVDGVPVKKGEYDQRVRELMDEGTFRLLTDPRHFNENLHWTDRRKLLLEVCGDVTQDAVIASEPRLAELPDFLVGRSIDDHRKVVHASRVRVNDELKRLPDRIDEVSRMLADAPVPDDSLAAAERTARELVESLRTDRAELVAGSGAATTERARLREIDDRLARIAGECRHAADEANRDADTKRRTLNTRLTETRQGIARAEAEAREAAAAHARAESDRERLRSEWQTVNARKIEVHTVDTCPACQQALPAERVHEAHETALAELNGKKAAELERIHAAGVAAKAQADRLHGEIEAANSKRLELDRERVSIEAELSTLPATIPAVDPATLPEHQALTAERSEVEQRITEATSGSQAAIADLDARLASANQELATAQAATAKAAQRSTLEARVEQLAEQEKTLAAEYESLEHQLHLLDLFVETQADLLNSRINAKFALVEFRMFEPQFNDGLKPMCEATVNGVPYGDLNNAGRIKAGLDIINTLAEHHAFWPFIVIDNAEAVTRLTETVGQQIRLVVNATDKTLRVESVNAVAA